MSPGKEKSFAPVAQSSPRTWIFAFILMSGVFICGAIVGVVITSGFLWDKTRTEVRPQGFPVDRIVERMDRELDLTDAQVDELETIFKKHHEDAKTLHKEMEPKILLGLETLRQDVESALDTKQAKRWNQRFNELKTHWIPPPPGQGPPGPPPPRGHRPPHKQGRPDHRDHRPGGHHPPRPPQGPPPGPPAGN